MEENNEILPDVKNIKTQESYTLPSKGLVYTAEENIPAALTLRRMTTKEEKMRLRSEGEEKIRRDLLQACILENIDVNLLKLEDANFLLFRLRALSLLDDTYKVRVVCPDCGTTFVHQLNLSEVPIKYMEQDKLENLKVILPVSGAKIDFKLPSIGDIIIMGDKIKEYLDKYPNVDRGEMLYTLSSMLYIDKIDGHEMLSEVLEDTLDNMDIIDARAIKDIINNLDGLYGFDENIKCECPNCKTEVTHGLPITSELFNPSR